MTPMEPTGEESWLLNKDVIENKQVISPPSIDRGLIIYALTKHGKKIELRWDDQNNMIMLVDEDFGSEGYIKLEDQSEDFKFLNDNGVEVAKIDDQGNIKARSVIISGCRLIFDYVDQTLKVRFLNGKVVTLANGQYSE
jgi:hypothetical protein